MNISQDGSGTITAGDLSKGNHTVTLTYFIEDDQGTVTFLTSTCLIVVGGDGPKTGADCFTC